MKPHRLQRRLHPIFSPLAIASTLVFVVALALGVVVSGGRAFSPGDLTGVGRSEIGLDGFYSHADFGDDCLQCHAPFQGVDAERCERCHETIGDERRAGEGLHGSYELGHECGACHQEHKGPDFDPVGAALANLDHAITGFALTQHSQDFNGTSLECTVCHEGERDFVIRISSCEECHVEETPDFMKTHIVAYGPDCLVCHDGLDTMAQFDNEQHAELFPLLGAHDESACDSCHVNGQFEGIQGECMSCHLEPALHADYFGAQCEQCHDAFGWKPALLEGLPFGHSDDTRFTLKLHITTYQELPFTCATCHVDEQFLFSENQCIDCHAAAEPEFVRSHTEQVGEACLACHDGSGEIAEFDHALVWPLLGKHGTVECTACHQNQQFIGTSGDCVACHAEPDIHFGLFGSDCATCHTAEGWLPAMLIRHSFPLDHGDQGETACASCHPATYAEYTCYGCHEHDPVEVEQSHREEDILPPELYECVLCHPTGLEHEVQDDD